MSRNDAAGRSRSVLETVKDRAAAMATPGLDVALRSEVVATILQVGLRLEAYARRETERGLRRMWHRFNIPTASDVRRMTERVDIVDHQIHELSARLAAAPAPPTARRRPRR